MSRELPFEPLALFSDPHKQTIGGALLHFQKEPLSVMQLVHLSDGDKLALEVTTPKNWTSKDLTVVMIHGCCGSHVSPYLVRLANRLEPLGVKCIRLNLRGCGSGRGLNKQIYHGGRSEDVFEALKLLKLESPDSPIVLIGFSLGANITLKLAGELNTLGSEYLEGAIAIAPPVDLYQSVQMLGEKQNGVYERCFIKIIKEEIAYMYRINRDLPRIRIPKQFKWYEFDQFFTAPSCGFKSAFDYYNKCSSVQFVEDIDIPCRILFAKDDPLIAHTGLDHCQLSSNVEIYKTNHGGHMGFLGNPRSDRGFRWLDSLIEEWIFSMIPGQQQQKAG
jgi:hypothetical protein